MSDYLWDKSGEDAEIQELEQLLGGLRYEGSAPEQARAPRRRWPWGLLAAGLLAAVGLPWLFQEPTTGWAMTQLEGESTCGEAVCLLPVGEWLETGTGRVELEVADIGTMEVAPGSRLRLKNTGAKEHRLELAEGRVDALVVAPPRLLVVETPAATAVDLGCAYTLEVDEDGDGMLIVSSGWVALERDDYAAFVPAGAEAPISSVDGPGLPVRWDAPPAIRALNAGGPVDEALAASRLEDTLTLWHLLQTSDPLPVLDQIETLAPGSVVERDALATNDPLALTRLRETLEPHWF